jgi:hypothetical protein
VLGKAFGPLLCRRRQSTDREAFNDAEPVAAVVSHLIEFYGAWRPTPISPCSWVLVPLYVLV